MPRACKARCAAARAYGGAPGGSSAATPALQVGRVKRRQADERRQAELLRVLAPWPCCRARGRARRGGRPSPCRRGRPARAPPRRGPRGPRRCRRGARGSSERHATARRRASATMAPPRTFTEGSWSASPSASSTSFDAGAFARSATACAFTNHQPSWSSVSTPTRSASADTPGPAASDASAASRTRGSGSRAAPTRTPARVGQARGELGRAHADRPVGVVSHGLFDAPGRPARRPCAPARRGARAPGSGRASAVSPSAAPTGRPRSPPAPRSAGPRRPA